MSAEPQGRVEADLLVRVLGPTRTATTTAPPQRRDRVVLAALAVVRGASCSPERLAEALWGDTPPRSAAKVVQGAIGRLRSALGAAAIETVTGGYRLAVAPSHVDAGSFELLLERGRELLALQQFDQAAATLSDALTLWEGEPFSDISDWEPAIIEGARLEELRLQAEELSVEARLFAGDAEGCTGRAQALARESPLRERRWWLLALALYRSGRPGESLDALRRCRAVFRDELGFDVSSDIDDLEAKILRRDPSLQGATDDVPATTTCPWPGLESYDAAAAEMFFGREGDVASALAQLRARGALVVVGPSGVGKSSLLRAGLVPALRSEGRTARVMTPGPTPPSRIESVDVLVVDQLEEAFSLCHDESARQEFFAAVTRQADHGLLVMALRADRMADVVRSATLARLVENGIYLLGPLDERGLRSAITSPAARAGLRIEPGLVDLLVREVSEESGALPLLSHALVQTWTRRRGRTLTVEGYTASGGVRGAVAQSAEAVYGNLTVEDQASLRHVMLRLVSAGPEGEPTRARVPRHLVAGDPDSEHVVEVLVGSRLVTSDDGSITLTHESLVRAWPRLREWLDDDVEGRRILHHLSASADAWEALGRPATELYRGVRLARALEWRSTAAHPLAPSEAAFLDASRLLERSERDAAEERARLQVRTNRRLRLLATGVTALLVVAVVGGMLAVEQRGRADDAALAADARRVGGLALREPDVSRSLLLAVAAAQLDPSPDTRASLEASLALRPELLGIRQVASKTDLSTVVALADGVLSVASADHQVRLTTMSGSDPRASYRPTQDPPDIWPAAQALSSAQGVLALTAGPEAPRPVRLLDPSTLAELPAQLTGWPQRSVAVMGLATSTNGRYLAASINFPQRYGQIGGRNVGGQVIVWDLATAGYPVVGRVSIPDQFYGAVAVTSDGKTVYTTGPLSAYDTRSGRRLFQGDVFSGLLKMDIRARDGRLAMAVADGSLDVLVLSSSGEIVQRLRGHTGHATDLAFSHDGSMLAATGEDGLALVWDVESGDLLHRIDTGAAVASGLAFSEDDGILYTVLPAGRQVQAWDLDGAGSRIRRLPGVEAVPMERGGAARASADGRFFAVAQQAPTETNDQAVDVRVVDLDSGTTQRLAARDAGWLGASSFSPDGLHYAMGFRDGVVQVLSRVSGKEVVSRRVVDGFVTEVSYSPDGSEIAVVDEHGQVAQVDPATLEPSGRSVTLTANAYGVAAAPEGRAFVIAGGREWRVYWDVPIDRWFVVDLSAAGVVRQGPLTMSSAFYTAISPDGRHVTVGGKRGEVEFLDPASGQAQRPTSSPHSGRVLHAAYSRDGGRVATVSTGGEVALWDPRSGALVGSATLPVAEEPRGVAIRGDGTVAILSRSGAVFEWSPGIESAMAFACRAAGRDLTRDEWTGAFGSRPYRSTCARS